MVGSDPLSRPMQTKTIDTHATGASANVLSRGLATVTTAPKRIVVPPPALPKPPSKWTAAVAAVVALALHAGAVIYVEFRPEDPPLEVGASFGSVEAIIEGPAPQAIEPPLPPEEPEPLEASAEPSSPPEFVEDAAPVQKKATGKRLVRPITQPGAVGGFAGTVPASSAKTVAISAPRPDYPYEARRNRITGSGVMLMIVHRPSGRVTNVVVAESTGSPVLDHAATSAFHRWRFQPDTVSRVRVPITFTLTGAQV